MRTIQQQLTVKELKRNLTYDPNSGKFTWICLKRGVKIGNVAGTYNRSSGYNHICLDGVIYQEHRLVWLYMTGKHPKNGLEIDHIDHNRLNNTWINLRTVTKSENQHNRKLSVNNVTGYNGVCFNKNANKFQVTITINNSTVYLGLYDTLSDAISVRSDANKQFNFHPNHGAL